MYDSMETINALDTLMTPPKSISSLVSHHLPQQDEERQARLDIKPGFHLKPPPAPHLLDRFFTSDHDLFETIHMGAVTVDSNRWQLVVDGLVQKPFVCNLAQLKEFPRTDVTAFHECYGSPLKPPTTPVWRIGNVTWTGVRLRTLLDMAHPLDKATYVWSDGLDSGQFGGKTMDRYQKDLPIAKAVTDEVLLAYEINGEPLRVERGGPVRLVVPGWFGTNSTKWLCKLTLCSERSQSHFTTTWYNEEDSKGQKHPIWAVEPNSIIVDPTPDSWSTGSQVRIHGWAWSHDGIADVSVSADGGTSWTKAEVDPRLQLSWQGFQAELELSKGCHTVIACATSTSGISQPMSGRRNHCHSVLVNVP